MISINMIVLGACFFLVMYGIALYNGLVRDGNNVKQSLSGIQTMLTKRFELLPNLVATIKQYASHEKEVLNKVTELRATLNSSKAIGSLQQVDGKSAQLMGQIFAIAEAYPELKSDANFLHLQRTLHETEEQLSAARRAYNSAVTDLNNRIMMFPSNILARTFAFKTAQVYEAPENHFKLPDVNELFRKAS